MIADFEKFHGVALRELIVSSEKPLRFERAAQAGRIHSYVLNGVVGIHIKHSAKRIPPWQFTFTRDQVSELAMLRAQMKSLWFLLICGSDGIVALADIELAEITGDIDKGTLFVRIDRDRRSRYRIFGSAGQLTAAKPSGVGCVLRDALVLSSSAGTTLTADIQCSTTLGVMV